jgi:hypothetical protein
MSRSGYSDDCEHLAMWRGQVASATRGKRGQAFLKDLVDALEAMPEKRLIQNELKQGGEVCALGALGAKRGMDMSTLDPEDYMSVAAAFGIAHQLAQEVVFKNDEQFEKASPEQRYEHMLSWAKSHLKAT